MKNENISPEKYVMTDGYTSTKKIYEETNRILPINSKYTPGSDIEPKIKCNSHSVFLDRDDNNNKALLLTKRKINFNNIEDIDL